jgi:hypothetical protein
VDTPASTQLTQRQLDSILRRAVIFSLIWLFGIGSAYAFVQALRAKREVDHSDGTLRGSGRIWWCLIIGAVGMVLWLPILAVGLVNQFR